jgi:hypothetical protein
MTILSGMTNWKKQLNPRGNLLRDIAIPYEVRRVLIQCIQTIGYETSRLNHSGDLIEIASTVRFTEAIPVRDTFRWHLVRLLYLFR